MRRHAAAMYKTTHDERAGTQYQLIASNRAHSGNVIVYAGRRRAANNPLYYDCVEPAPPPRLPPATHAVRTACARQAVAVYRLLDAVRLLCLSVCLSLFLFLPLYGLLPSPDRITSRSLRQILSSVGKPDCRSATSSSAVGLVG